MRDIATIDKELQQARDRVETLANERDEMAGAEAVKRADLHMDWQSKLTRAAMRAVSAAEHRGYSGEGSCNVGGGIFTVTFEPADVDDEDEGDDE